MRAEVSVELTGAAAGSPRAAHLCAAHVPRRGWRRRLRAAYTSPQNQPASAGTLAPGPWPWPFRLPSACTRLHRQQAQRPASPAGQPPGGHIRTPLCGPAALPPEAPAPAVPGSRLQLPAWEQLAVLQGLLSPSLHLPGSQQPAAAPAASPEPAQQQQQQHSQNEAGGQAGISALHGPGCARPATRFDAGGGRSSG
jgi:hypothetical protein